MSNKSTPTKTLPPAVRKLVKTIRRTAGRGNWQGTEVCPACGDRLLVAYFGGDGWALVKCKGGCVEGSAEWEVGPVRTSPAPSVYGDSWEGMGDVESSGEPLY